MWDIDFTNSNAAAADFIITPAQVANILADGLTPEQLAALALFVLSVSDHLTLLMDPDSPLCQKQTTAN